MAVRDDVDDADVRAVGGVFHDRTHEVKDADPAAPDDSVIAECALGYGVLGLGAELEEEGDGLFSPFVERMLAESPIPVLLVRRAFDLDRPLPPAFARAVVPIGGTKASRAAQEVAFNLSAAIGTEVHLTHVSPGAEDHEVATEGSIATPATGGPVGGGSPAGPQLAQRLIDEASALGSGVDARLVHSVRTAPSTAEGILAAVRAEDADLVVLGAQVRIVDGRPFLGHTVDQVIRRCAATVIVVTHR